jgi:alanine racemase
MIEIKHYSKFIVNLDNLKYNIETIRKYVKSDFIMVLKNDAYGNGASTVGRYLESLGMDKFAVVSLKEAYDLRKENIKSRIIILGKVFLDNFKDIIELNLEPTIFNLKEFSTLENLCQQYNKKVKIHINVETGMNRLGSDFEAAKEIIQKSQNSKSIEIAGVYSHFSSPNDPKYSQFQIENFKKFIKSLDKKYYCHFSNSVPSFNYKDSQYDAVRIGIMAWGINQSKADIKLKRVSSLVSEVVKIKRVKKGESVGYERKFIAKDDCSIAVLQIGYGDGLPYNLNKGGKVFINDKIYEVVGSVCMDHIFVKVDDSVKVGDEAEIFGENIKIEDLAGNLNTIPYDIMVKINSNIPRVYIKNDKFVSRDEIT